ncbi:hypothetical protein PSCICL_33310 [Pseudomonas cichorii]|nr:hypothetical protein PSCICL_33310 [Pseudomonas cichorii]
MKKVLKGIEPLSFTNWKAKAERENRTLTYKSLTRSAPQKKKEVHESLLREQAYMCCYCGDEISENQTTSICSLTITTCMRPACATWVSYNK